MKLLGVAIAGWSLTVIAWWLLGLFEWSMRGESEAAASTALGALVVLALCEGLWRVDRALRAALARRRRCS